MPPKTESQKKAAARHKEAAKKLAAQVKLEAEQRVKDEQRAERFVYEDQRECACRLLVRASAVQCRAMP